MVDAVEPVAEPVAVMPALNAAFIRLGFSEAAAAILADRGKENIDLAALALLDDKQVKTLCMTMRKPGGWTEVLPATDGRPATRTPNPGEYVSAKAEMNLTVACYMAKHYQRTSRTLTAQHLTIDRVMRYAQFKEAEDAYKEPDDAMKLVKPEKVTDFIDEWPDHLALYDGQNGRPLAYVIRDLVAVAPETFDHAFGEVDSVYASLRDEIKARARHDAHQYHVDSARVFELLNEAVSEHKHVKTWIKPFAATRNGRGAWIAFKAHFRGSSELEAIEMAAENKLEKLAYTGEKNRYTFETHVSMHRRAHQDLEQATGRELPQATKVRRLLKSLQVSSLAVAVATIRAQDNLRTDFDSCVNYLRSFISSTEHTESRVIASTSTGGSSYKKGGRNGGKGSTYKKDGNKTLDRYYRPHEWRALDAEKRQKIIDARKKRNVSDVSLKNAKEDNDVVTSQRSKSKKPKKDS